MFTVAYDIYATIYHLLATFPEPFLPPIHAIGGQSLLEDIPSQRNCEDALGTTSDCDKTDNQFWCPFYVCSCMNWQPLLPGQNRSGNEGILEKIDILKGITLRWMNEHNQKYHQCVPLQVKVLF